MRSTIAASRCSPVPLFTSPSRPTLEQRREVHLLAPLLSGCSNSSSAWGCGSRRCSHPIANGTGVPAARAGLSISFITDARNAEIWQGFYQGIARRREGFCLLRSIRARRRTRRDRRSRASTPRSAGGDVEALGHFSGLAGCRSLISAAAGGAAGSLAPFQDYRWRWRLYRCFRC